MSVETEVAPEAEAEEAKTLVPWYGVLAPVGVMSGDNRIFDEGAITYRDFPLPFKAMRKDLPGHDESVVVGNITNAWEDPATGLIKGEGTFASNEDAEYFIQLRKDEAMRGVSVDLDMAESQVEDMDGNKVDLMNDPFDPEAKYVERVTSGRMASATICPIPAFQEAWFNLGTWADHEVEEDEEPVDPDEEDIIDVDSKPINAAGGWAAPATGAEELALEPGDYCVFEDCAAKATQEVTLSADTSGMFCDEHAAQAQAVVLAATDGVATLSTFALGTMPVAGSVTYELETMRPAYTMVDVVESLTASAAAPPRAWFENPNLEKLTPLTVTEDGRVFGHAAGWGTCHIGLDKCVMAPKSASKYAYFHTGELLTAEGPVPVGNITMRTGHAGLSLAARAAAAHYDNTGTAVADVVAGEDRYGIWIAGQIRPNLTEEQVREFRASAVSGDWRKIAGQMEFVAALAVNVPGFPIPRTAMAASGMKQTALVAAAIVVDNQREHDQDDALTELARAVVREFKADSKRTARAEELRAQLDKDNPERREAVLVALGEDE